MSHVLIITGGSAEALKLFISKPTGSSWSPTAYRFAVRHDLFADIWSEILIPLK